MTGGGGVVVLGVGVKSNLIQYLIPIHVALWYDRWGEGAVVVLGVGVKLNLIHYLHPIRVGLLVTLAKSTTDD